MNLEEFKQKCKKVKVLAKQYKEAEAHLNELLGEISKMKTDSSNIKSKRKKLK